MASRPPQTNCPAQPVWAGIRADHEEFLGYGKEGRNGRETPNPSARRTAGGDVLMPRRPKEPYAVAPRPLPSGRWKGRVVRYDPETGHRHELTQTFDTKREAKAWAEAEAAKYREDPHRKPPSDETLGAYFERWVRDVVAVQDSTRADYRRMGAYAVERLGQKPLKSLTAVDVQGLYAELSRAGLSGRTVRYVHAVLHHALRDAVNFGLIPANPTDKVHPPKLQARLIVPPTREEIAAFLTAADQHRLRALWYVLALTGLRRGEALGLQWSDIHWDTKTLTVQRNIIEKSGLGVRIHSPKTNAGRRTIALSSYLLDILRDHQATQDLERQAAGTAWSPEQWVFTTRTGGLLIPRNVHRAFQRLMAQAGIQQPVRIHDLRHAMASFWLASGVPVKVVSERLGHADIHITLQVYGHLLPTLQAAAAEEMDAHILRTQPVSALPADASRAADGPQKLYEKDDTPHA